MENAEFSREIFKMVAQCLVAFSGLYLAVYLALDRYKAEKIWERRLSLYCDAVMAMSEILDVHETECFLYDDGGPGPERRAELNSRHQAASRKLDDILALSRLVTPGAVTILEAYLDDLASAEFDEITNEYDDLLLKANVARRRRADLIEQGQSELGIAQPLSARLRLQALLSRRKLHG